MCNRLPHILGRQAASQDDWESPCQAGRTVPVGAHSTAPTPGAQVPGPQRGQLSVRWHSADSEACVGEAIRFSAPPLAVQCAVSPGGVLDIHSLIELDDARVIVSAIEPRPRGRVVVRVYNASGQERAPSLRWRVGEARFTAVDLSESERPDVRLRANPGDPGVVQLRLRAWEIFTLRIEPAS